MAYVVLDKIKSTAHIESIVANADLAQGAFVELGALQADGEARLATPSADVKKQLVFHASVPLMYGEREREQDFVLKAGKVGRGYVLEDGDIVSIEATAITGTVASNAFVKPAIAGFEVAETEPTGLHGQIIETYTDAVVGAMVTIRIIK